jgi:hypothetical protein
MKLQHYGLELMVIILITGLLVSLDQYWQQVHCFLVYGQQSVYFAPCISAHKHEALSLTQYLVFAGCLFGALVAGRMGIPEWLKVLLAVVIGSVVVVMVFNARPEMKLWEYASIFGRKTQTLVVSREVMLGLIAVLFLGLWRNYRFLFLPLLALTAVLAYGIPLLENKTSLYGNEDPTLLFTHTRHLVSHGFFTYDPNDIVGGGPDLVQPLFHVTAAVLSELCGIDALYTWPALSFLASLASTFFLFAIGKIFLKDERWAVVAAVAAHAVGYRTLAWTHPEVLGYMFSCCAIWCVLAYWKTGKRAYMVTTGLMLGAVGLTYATAFVFGVMVNAGLMATLFIYHIIKNRVIDWRLFIAPAISAVIIWPYYAHLFAETEISGARLSYVGSKWFPLVCTERQECSPVFAAVSVGLLLIFIAAAWKSMRSFLLAVIVFSSLILLYNHIPYRLGWSSVFFKCDRYSSYAWPFIAIGCAWVAKRFSNKVLGASLLFVMFFSGFYYTVHEADGASFDIRPDVARYELYAWARDSIERDSLVLIYGMNSVDTAYFYDVTGLQYLLPNGKYRTIGTTWESGFLSGTRYHKDIIDRTDEWLNLDKGDVDAVKAFVEKYRITHLLVRKKKLAEGELEVITEIATQLKCGRGNNYCFYKIDV